MTVVCIIIVMVVGFFVLLFVLLSAMVLLVYFISLVCSATLVTVSLECLVVESLCEKKVTSFVPVIM